jgi:hypothetical protein
MVLLIEYYIDYVEFNILYSLTSLLVSIIRIYITQKKDSEDYLSSESFLF